jgi:hypothetical protein
MAKCRADVGGDHLASSAPGYKAATRIGAFRNDAGIAPSMGLRGRRPYPCNSSIFNTGLIRWDARFERGVASSADQPLGKRGRVGEELLWVVVADEFEEGEAIVGEGLDAVEVSLPLR